MSSEPELSEPARLLLLVSLLAKDRLISHNGKAFLKELILRRDPTLLRVFEGFGSDPDFLEHVFQLIDRESKAMYEALFSEFSLSAGKSLSKAERTRRNLVDDKSLIYGEVEFLSFAMVLREVAARTESKPGGIFYDLGSGTGKAVFVARLTQDFRHCVGIEILEPLHTAAQQVMDDYNAIFRDRLDSSHPQHAAVYSGSFIDRDWSDGDVVFANSTCFPDDLMNDLARQAEKLKEGAVMITFTKGLPSRLFEVIDKRRFEMSWGPATVFVHRKLPTSDDPPRRTRANLAPPTKIMRDRNKSAAHSSIPAGAHEPRASAVSPRKQRNATSNAEIGHGSSFDGGLQEKGELRAEKGRSESWTHGAGRLGNDADDRHDGLEDGHCGVEDNHDGSDDGIDDASEDGHGEEDGDGSLDYDSDSAGWENDFNGLEDHYNGLEDDIDNDNEDDDDAEETYDERRGAEGRWRDGRSRGSTTRSGEEDEDGSDELMFDTGYLKGAASGDEPSSSPPSEHLQGFGALLREAEAAEEQALERLYASREALREKTQELDAVKSDQERTSGLEEEGDEESCASLSGFCISRGNSGQSEADECNESSGKKMRISTESRGDENNSGLVFGITDTGAKSELVQSLPRENTRTRLSDEDTKAAATTTSTLELSRGSAVHEDLPRHVSLPAALHSSPVTKVASVDEAEEERIKTIEKSISAGDGDKQTNRTKQCDLDVYGLGRENDDSSDNETSGDTIRGGLAVEGEGCSRRGQLMQTERGVVVGSVSVQSEPSRPSQQSQPIGLSKGDGGLQKYGDRSPRGADAERVETDQCGSDQRGPEPSGLGGADKGHSEQRSQSVGTMQQKESRLGEADGSESPSGGQHHEETVQSEPHSSRDESEQGVMHQNVGLQQQQQREDETKRVQLQSELLNTEVATAAESTAVTDTTGAEVVDVASRGAVGARRDASATAIATQDDGGGDCGIRTDGLDAEGEKGATSSSNEDVSQDDACRRPNSSVSIDAGEGPLELRQDLTEADTRRGSERKGEKQEKCLLHGEGDINNEDVPLKVQRALPDSAPSKAQASGENSEKTSLGHGAPPSPLPPSS